MIWVYYNLTKFWEGVDFYKLVKVTETQIDDEHSFDYDLVEMGCFKECLAALKNIDKCST